jgi:hypothetical protein
MDSNFLSVFSSIIWSMNTDVVSIHSPGPPPYVSFSTVMKVVDGMVKDGTPAVVDRSYLGSMSNGYKTQVLAALRTLALIHENGAPTRQMLDISVGRVDFATHLQMQMRHVYARAISIAESNGTTGQLESAFREEFNISGSTLQGAIRFYIEASKVAGLPLSPYFKTPTRATPSRATKTPKTRQDARKRLGQFSSGDADVPVTSPPRGYNVSLQSGGSVTLVVNVDLFDLSNDDRDFVFRLIDAVRQYDATRGPESPEEIEEKV